jgi:spore coat protein U-like protein
MPLFNIVVFCTALTSKRMAFMWMSLLAVSVLFNLHMLASRDSCSLSSVLHTGGHGLTSVELPRSPSEIEVSASPTNACSFSPQKQISFGKTVTTVHINVGMWMNLISCDPSTCYAIGFEPNLEHYGHDS